MSAGLSSEEILFLQRGLKSGGLYVGPLDGLWNAEIDAAEREFHRQSQDLSRAIGTFDLRTERNIATLQLPAQEAARRTMRVFADMQIVVRIISGTRTYEQQEALFAKGRFGNTEKKVTNARGGESNHNFAIAWDIGIFDGGRYLEESPLYKEVGHAALARVPSIEWGGLWVSFTDRPHYQLQTGLALADVRSRFESGMRYFP